MRPTPFLLLALCTVCCATVHVAAAPQARAGKKSSRTHEARAHALKASVEGKVRSLSMQTSLLSMMAGPTLAGVVSVVDFGAVGTNSSFDNTAAFQSALNAVSPGGGIVYVPPGSYAFSGSLTIPVAVSLVGTYRAPPAHNVGQGGEAPNTGSVLIPRGGQGNASATPFITMQDDSTLTGVVIYYDGQPCTNAPPVAYPWTVDMDGENCAVTDCEFLNSFLGIRAVAAPRHYIARVQGQLLDTGISIDQTYDIGRVEDVHYNPWYCGLPGFMSHATSVGTGFLIARTDWEYVFNTFVFGSAIGYHFVESSTGSCNGNFVGIGADLAANASVQIDQADEWGILIVNMEATSFCDGHFCNTTADSTQVVVSASNTGAVRITNSAFWGPSHANVRVYGGDVSIQNSVFTTWDAANTGRHSVEVYGGSIQLIGNDWQANLPQVSVGESAARAVIVGNLLVGEPQFQVNGTSTVTQIDLNAGTV
jgi:Pectate lyase superfamily protein